MAKSIKITDKINDYKEIETELSIDKEQLSEIEKSIAEMEKKLFPNLHLDASSHLPDPAQEKQKTLEQIEESYKLALEHYQANKFIEAEKELVKALRPTLSKPLMKSLYVNTEEVKEQVLDAMYHLGLVYLKDSQYFIHHAKAASIFQYCAAFAKKYGMDQEQYLVQAHNVEKEFLESIEIDTANYNSTRGQIDNYRSELETLRIQTKQKLAEINNLNVKAIAKRAGLVEGIYQDCSSSFVNRKGEGLVQKLLADCYLQLGGLPEGCEYAVTALGSLSLGTMTPWSDLEFAILVNDDKYKEYFRNVSKLFHIKVINLGETHLKSMGVESLNNFKTDKPEDEWFWDDVMKIKFNFDSARWDACKVPLGRQGGYKVSKKIKVEDGTEKKITITKPDYELILTPDQMLEFQKEEWTILEEDSNELKNWYETDQFLVQALHSVALIDGSQSLLDGYKAKVKVAEEPQILQKRVLDKLQDELSRFKLKLGDEEEGKLMDTKQEIYRIGDRVVNGLAHYYNITAKEGEPVISVWQTIDEMEAKGILSQGGAQHLREAVSIATELRLRTYANNDTREETLSTFIPAVDHLSEEHKHKLLKETFYFQDTAVLHHFYYVMLSMQELTEAFCIEEYHGHAETYLKNNNLFSDNNYAKGMIHARFLEYDKALEYMAIAKEEQPQSLHVLENLYFLYCKTGIYDGAVNIGKEILKLVEAKHQDDSFHLDIASSYSNAGVAHRAKGEYDEAIKCYNKALIIGLKTCNKQFNYPHVSSIYANLGSVYVDKGDYDGAIKYYNQALQIHLEAYDYGLKLSDLAGSYRNLGNAYSHKGEYDKAIKYCKRASDIISEEYSHSPNRPDIATSCNNMASVYCHQGEYDEAIKYYNQALKIQGKAYRNKPSHPDTASSYINLGMAYACQQKYKKAAGCLDEALIIQTEAYKEHPEHPSVARNYEVLGRICRYKGEYDKAIVYHEQALEIWLKVHKSSPNHPDIGMSHNNLGNVHYMIGVYDKAIEYYKKALDIKLEVYKSNSGHPEIATSHNNLGATHLAKGKYEQAREHFEQALEIYLKVYESNPNHPHIVSSYNNLGIIYQYRNDLENAILYRTQALKILQKVFGHDSAHPDIARTLNDLAFIRNNVGTKKLHEWSIAYTSKAKLLHKLKEGGAPYTAEYIIESYDKALAFDPSNIEVLECKEQIASQVAIITSDYEDFTVKEETTMLGEEIF